MFKIPSGTPMTPELLGKYMTKHKQEISKRYQKLHDAYENDYDIIYRNHGTFTSHKELLDNVIECCDLILTRQDAHFPILFHGIQLYACHETKTNGQGRRDGKEGNILYSLDKVK